jgi:hypothetical protein
VAYEQPRDTFVWKTVRFPKHQEGVDRTGILQITMLGSNLCFQLTLLRFYVTTISSRRVRSYDLLRFYVTTISSRLVRSYALLRFYVTTINCRWVRSHDSLLPDPYILATVLIFRQKQSLSAGIETNHRIVGTRLDATAGSAGRKTADSVMPALE